MWVRRLCSRAVRGGIFTGSQAYAKALARAGVITEHESKELVEGLAAVAAEWRSDSFVIKPHDEDIHTGAVAALRGQTSWARVRAQPTNGDWASSSAA